MSSIFIYLRHWILVNVLTGAQWRNYLLVFFSIITALLDRRFLEEEARKAKEAEAKAMEAEGATKEVDATA